ncbi:hypothetical protein ACJMK2_014338 [Sinanodonta woodiana]|uniref:SET domain-containing protein n=1 Tax=Sinanodonta woodiana TaxID=1069815 RepID=A0ABD3V0F1_SINWO
MGRMVNDATSSNINSKMEVVSLNNIPYFCLFALREIKAGEEILYDYGEKNMHWRKELSKNNCLYFCYVFNCFRGKKRRKPFPIR